MLGNQYILWVRAEVGESGWTVNPVLHAERVRIPRDPRGTSGVANNDYCKVVVQQL